MKLTGIEVEAGFEKCHFGISFLAESLAGATVDEAPFTVPGKTFWFYCPRCISGHGISSA